MQAIAQHADVPRPPKEEETVQIGMRLEKSLVEQLDQAAWNLSKPGKIVTRTEVIKILLRQGLSTPHPKSPKK